MTRVAAWLDPTGRKRVYSALLAVGAVLVVAGIVTDSAVSGWVGVVDSTLSVAALLMASYQARKISWTALYAGAAVLAGSLRAVGILDEAVASHWLDILAAAAAAGPLLAAMLRTDPATPTGEPLAEYVGRHAAPADPGPLHPTVSSEGITFSADTKADAAHHNPRND